MFLSFTSTFLRKLFETQLTRDDDMNSALNCVSNLKEFPTQRYAL
jgi:hypothetical protein